MAPFIDKMPLYENPNTIPLKTKAQSPHEPPSSPPAMHRDGLYRWSPAVNRSRSPRPRSPPRVRSPPRSAPPRLSPRPRSPPQPVQPFRIHEDREIADELAADQRSLLEQLEKLTLKLDIANNQVALQTQRIADLSKMLKGQEILVEQYQKRVRRDQADKDAALEEIKRVVEKAERFKSTIVRLSHRVHHMHTAVINADVPDRLKEQFMKLKMEGSLVKDDPPKGRVKNRET